MSHVVSWVSWHFNSSKTASCLVTVSKIEVLINWMLQVPAQSMTHASGFSLKAVISGNEGVSSASLPCRVRYNVYIQCTKLRKMSSVCRATFSTVSGRSSCDTVSSSLSTIIGVFGKLFRSFGSSEPDAAILLNLYYYLTSTAINPMMPWRIS